MVGTPSIAQSSTAEQLPFSSDPELVFALVGPVGVDLGLVEQVLQRLLSEYEYTTSSLRITDLMREVKVVAPLDARSYIDSVRQRIAYANRVCEKIGRKDALAVLAISAIRETRHAEGGSEVRPLKRRAYLIHQFKRPEEVQLLRSVYGKQFIQISAYAPQAYRIETIIAKELKARREENELVKRSEVVPDVTGLVKQDDSEQGEQFGQNVRDAFPLADVFVSTHDPDSCRLTLKRFIYALFGDDSITPDKDEYGMYMAKSASLRSSSSSRQVGAAIFTEDREIVALGCNEVPKGGGGTYWTGDKNDSRDFVLGADPSDSNRRKLLIDIFERLLRRNHLSTELCSIGDPEQIVNILSVDQGPDGVAESRVMDILEFGRDIHAEMSAISDAARNGLSVRGSVLYSTTFPCHICAKHIVASGIKRVVYVEPYPKSYAEELHSDSIEIDSAGSNSRVGFQRFIGIAPYRYRDLFERGVRKYLQGASRQENGKLRPLIDVLHPSFAESETYVVDVFKTRLGKVVE